MSDCCRSLTRKMLLAVIMLLALGTSSARKHVAAETALISKYIDSLVLGDMTKLTDVIYSNNTEQGFVTGSCAIGFTNQVSAQHKQDFNSALLVAQLNSDYLFDRYSQATQWYQNYMTVLSKLGMTTMQQSSWAAYKGTDGTFTIANAALDVFSSLSLLAVVKKSMESLKNPDSDRFKVFAQSSESGAGDLNFQISVVDEVGGVASVVIGGYQMSTTDNPWQFLWFEWKTSQVTLQYMTTTLTLSDSLWNKGLRQQVYAKVADYVDHYVLDLEF